MRRRRSSARFQVMRTSQTRRWRIAGIFCLCSMTRTKVSCTTSSASVGLRRTEWATRKSSVDQVSTSAAMPASVSAGRERASPPMPRPCKPSRTPFSSMENGPCGRSSGPHLRGRCSGGKTKLSSSITGGSGSGCCGGFYCDRRTREECARGNFRGILQGLKPPFLFWAAQRPEPEGSGYLEASVVEDFRGHELPGKPRLQPWHSHWAYLEAGSAEGLVKVRVEHKPFAAGEVKLMLIEPKGVVNTGDAGGEMTAKNDVWV